MDTDKQLNMQAEQFLRTQDSGILTEMYRSLYRHWIDTAKTVAISLRTDASEVLSLYNEVFMKSIRSFRGGDFARLLSRSLKNARASFSRKQSVRLRYCQSFNAKCNDDDDEDTPMSEFVSDYILEDHANYRMYRKKEADQRQLIDFVLDRANDPVTTLIVTKCRENGFGKMSITALAKALGLHPEVVKRKLRALSRHYDANRFGDIADYLAV